MEEAALVLLRNEKPDIDQLAGMLNEMIDNDFSGLVQLLYRVDVPEQEVKQLLQEQPHADAGHLLARLLVKRHAAKQMMKKSFPSNPDIPEAERW